MQISIIRILERRKNMNNSYYDLYVKIEMPHDVSYKDLNNFLSDFINKSLLNDNKLKSMHETKDIKGYVISSLHPIEKDKIYKKGKIYIFNINCYDFYLCSRMKDCLKEMKDIKETNMRVHTFKVINELMMTTPAITSTENARYWTLDNSLAVLYEKIDKNMKHKANVILKIDRDKLETSENFIESLELRNDKDIIFNYKNGKLFAYSAYIKVKKDPMSQLLANLCIATGIGEKNSLGFGFCIERKEK
jgi:CRISPR-associated endoribonuclease Cas6